MRIVVAASVAVGLMMSTAFGQTTATYPSASPTIATIRSAYPTSALNPCYSTTNPTSPCYTGTDYPSYSAVMAELPPAKPTNHPFSVHSFTLDQAKARIEANGFSHVSDLRKDPHGDWRGKAEQDGKPVDVILYFEGKVAVE